MGEQMGEPREDERETLLGCYHAALGKTLSAHAPPTSQLTLPHSHTYSHSADSLSAAVPLLTHAPSAQLKALHQLTPSNAPQATPTEAGALA